MESLITLIPKPADPRPVLGSIYLGGMGAAMLFGATNLQVYYYFRNYKQDGIFQKRTVTILWLLDTLHMVISMVDLWHNLIASVGNYASLDAISWSTKAQLVITEIIILVVRSLYTWRAWKLGQGQNRLWPWILIIILVMGYASGIILLVEMDGIYTFAEVHHVRWSIYLGFIMSTFNDVMLATGMCRLLYPGTTMFAETKSMVWTIIRYVIITSALTSMCSIVAVTTFFVMPDNYVFFGITFLLPKLEINSYLAMLNLRKGIRDKAEDAETRISTMYFTSILNPSAGEAGSPVSRASDKGGVKVDVDIARQRRSRSVC